MSTIAVLGTFDTKGLEHAFAAQCIRERGHSALMIDAGAINDPRFADACVTALLENMRKPVEAR